MKVSRLLIVLVCLVGVAALADDEKDKEKERTEIRLAILFADIVNRTNIWVIESQCSLRLTPEPLERGGVVGHLRRKELEGYGAMQPSVFSLINHTHPASTQLFQDAVVGNCPPDDGRGIGHWRRMLGCVTGQVNEGDCP